MNDSPRDRARNEILALIIDKRLALHVETHDGFTSTELH
jgi:hypothetical protein